MFVALARSKTPSDFVLWASLGALILVGMITGSKSLLIARWEAIVFLGYYAAYVTFLVLNSSGHPATGWYSNIILWLVVPLTVLTPAIGVWRSMLERKSPTSV